MHGASGAAAAVKNPQASKSSFWGELPQHVMSGISRMVPTLIMGGVILAFSQLIAYSWLKIPADIGIMDALNSGKFSGFDLSLLKFARLSQSFGGVLFGFAIPMFAAFVANSIGGKLAFPAGFIGGLMSTQPTQLLNFDPSTMQWATSSPVPSTFIGALIISIVAGYLVKWMNQKIQLPDFLLAFKTTFCYRFFPPFCHAGDVLRHHPFGGWINGGIRTVLTAAGEKGALMYAMGIAAATAIDLGGPINKAAGFVAFSFTTDHVLPVTARSIAIVIPPIGLGLATIIDRRLTGNACSTPSFIRRVKPRCSRRLWGSVRVRFRLHWKALSPPFRRIWSARLSAQPPLSGWAQCNGSRSPLSGRGRWSLIWVSIWRGSRWEQSLLR